jgi:hypothetical protein
MKVPHAIRAQLRGIGRCAVTGMLVGLLATQAFALNAPAAPSSDSQLTTQTPDLPLIAEDNAMPEASLPSAPAPVADASVVSSQVTRRMDLMLAADGQNAVSSSTSTPPKKHKIRGGMLAMGIAGCGLAGIGAYIFSLNTNSKSTGLKDGLGTAFLAPGAAMAGLGFYFAFK